MQNVINIQVAVRIRDPKTKYQSCIKVLPPLPNRNITSFDLVDPEGKKQAKSFNFDNVYNTSCDQLLLYQTCVQPLIEKSLNGFNCSIFCYGQTASGKTYTMQGLPNNYDGILFKTFNQISNYKKNCKNIHFIIKLSYMEIYQETLIDLLVEKSEINSELKIRTDPESLSGKDLFVQGLTEKCIASEEEFKKLLIFGGKRRTVGGTQMNEVSSRSHAILTIIIDQISFGEKEIDINSSFSSLPRKRSKINLIDLAGRVFLKEIKKNLRILLLGSERSDSTGATGQRMKEGCAINQSLSCLGNVINALTTKQQGTKHVPFRDSKLTYLLRYAQH
ncbi:hypothetical protein HK099_004512 [Clydaea vesicula]|uniref:Kinesin motor domain-containing protein n=1 Tax=Clydaea vesicula TaxID=447962 RepID=A0AAD5Y1A5_9FUNG|nr:hypothetical protein HK099_004512 [Clydaea vesicula]